MPMLLRHLVALCARPLAPQALQRGLRALRRPADPVHPDAAVIASVPEGRTVQSCAVPVDVYGHGEQEIRDLAKRRTAGKAPIWAIAPKAEKA